MSKNVKKFSDNTTVPKDPMSCILVPTPLVMVVLIHTYTIYTYIAKRKTKVNYFITACIQFFSLMKIPPYSEKNCQYGPAHKLILTIARGQMNYLYVDENSHQFNFHMPHKKKDDFFSISKTCCKHTQTHTHTHTQYHTCK